MNNDTNETRLTWTVDEVAKKLGIGRGQAYAGVRTGAIPSIRIGKRYLVPIVAFERMLSAEPHKLT